MITFTSCILFCVLLYVICHSCTWPYGVGCVRNYAVTTVKTDETSVAIQSKQAQDFDWALNKLDSSVRRTGRITKTLLLRIFHDICRTGMETQLQSRTCNVRKNMLRQLFMAFMFDNAFLFSCLQVIQVAIRLCYCCGAVGPFCQRFP